MIRLMLKLVLAAMLLQAPIAFAKQIAATDKLQGIADQFIKKMFEFDPVYATEMGDHTYDDHYPDFSLRSFGKQADALREFQQELKGVNQAELSVEKKIDYLVLSGEIETQLLLLSRSLLMQDNPKLFSGKAIDGIYQIMLSQSLSDTTKLTLILERLGDLPRFLSSAQKLLKEPPQIWILLAEEETDKGSGFLTEVGNYFTKIFPDRQKEILDAVTTGSDALESYSDYLDILKTKEGQPFAVGKEFFDKMMKSEYFLDFDSDSLLKLGEVLFAQASRVYDSVSAIVDTMPAPEELTYFIPKSFNHDDVMDYFQWEINQSRDWVKSHEFATVPANIGACVPVETPAFLQAVVGGIAYQPPGPFESVQSGRFYVRPIPATLDDANRSAFFRYCYKRGFKSSTVHEAYPGHHLQIQIANRNPSSIRRIQRNSMMIEGWALYCEEEMYNQGFYGDDLRTYLGVLGGIRFRAARVIADVKLHTGQFTYQQTVDWMVANLDAEVDYIEKEVNRYTLSPTEPMTYLIGKQTIVDIRELYRVKLGQKFSLQKFNDFLLEQGPISPVYLYKQLAGQIF